MSVYTDYFFKGIDSGAARSAKRLVPIIRELVQPRSVLDVGCGSGAWLSQWMAEGVTDVFGVDGSYVDMDQLPIPADAFSAADLAEPLHLGRRFDLVSSLEVAEHLPAASAETFVESLVRHGDIVFFSAAVPGQGGTSHVNEQWPSYWVELFREHNFKVYDVLRSEIWGDPDVEWWYRQNCFIFATSGAAERHNLPSSSTGPLDLAHPGLIEALTSQTPIQLLRQQARSAVRQSPAGPPLKAIRDRVLKRR